MTSCPTYDAIQRVKRHINERGYRLGVFVCHGAARRDSLQTAIPGSHKFRWLELQPHYELVGVYGPDISSEELRGDVHSLYLP